MAGAMNRFGKWSQPGVHHRGWTRIEKYDSCPDGEPIWLVCEMCEKREIRHVHVMQHPGYPETLECGATCAKNMMIEYGTPPTPDVAKRRKSANAARRPTRNADPALSMVARSLDEGGRLTGRFRYAGLKFTISTYGGISVWTSWLPEKFLDPVPDTLDAAKALAIHELEKELARQGR